MSDEQLAKLGELLRSCRPGPPVLEMANMDDTIKAYVMNAAAGVKAWCSTCDRARVVWVAETKGGDTLTCCATCQRVITRRRTADIPPLSVNRAGA